MACVVGLGSNGFAQGTSLGSSSPLTATLTFKAGGTLNSINVLAQGAPNLDFQYAAGGTCTTGTAYSSGQSCTVNVNFKPRYPGLRLGAVLMRDASANVLATTYISGIGNGPLLAFNPGWQTTIGTGLNTPVAAAVDGAGNLYIVDNASGAPVVVKVTAGTSTQTIIGNCPNTTFACTLTDPAAVAVDGAGNVYIADHRITSEVVQVSADGATQSIVGGGNCVLSPPDPRLTCHLDSPTGVAVDGAGNVYITDNGTDFKDPQVLKVSADGSTQTQISPSSWFTGATAHSPMGVALDAAGNLYITDDGNSAANPAVPAQIVKIPAGSGTPVAINTGSACSLSTPVGVAVDAAGNLYIADPNNHCVVKVPPSGTPTNVGTGLVNPQSVVVDAADNVYIADYSMTHLVKLDRSDAPGTPVANGVPPLSLPTTPYRQQSNPPTAQTLENDGNQPLTFTAITAGTYLVLDTTTTCSTATPLAAAASCNLEIRFAPTVGGTLTGLVTLKNNALNSPQTVAAFGSVTNAPPLTRVTTLPVTSGGTTTVTMNGLVNPNGSATVYWFEYGPRETLTELTVAHKTPPGNLGAGATPVKVSAALSGAGSHPVYYRVVAQNSGGISQGHILEVRPGAQKALSGSSPASLAVSAESQTPTAGVVSTGSPAATTKNLNPRAETPATTQTATLEVELGRSTPLVINLVKVPVGTPIATTCAGLPEGATCSYDDENQTVTIAPSATTPPGSYSIRVTSATGPEVD
jgi:hypothetical protein